MGACGCGRAGERSGEGGVAWRRGADRRGGRRAHLHDGLRAVLLDEGDRDCLGVGVDVAVAVERGRGRVRETPGGARVGGATRRLPTLMRMTRRPDSRRRRERASRGRDRAARRRAAARGGDARHLSSSRAPHLVCPSSRLSSAPRAVTTSARDGAVPSTAKKPEIWHRGRSDRVQSLARRSARAPHSAFSRKKTTTEEIFRALNSRPPDAERDPPRYRSPPRGRMATVVQTSLSALLTDASTLEKVRVALDPARRFWPPRPNSDRGAPRERRPRSRALPDVRLLPG